MADTLWTNTMADSITVTAGDVTLTDSDTINISDYVSGDDLVDLTSLDTTFNVNSDWNVPYTKLEDRISQIERRLEILTPNPKLEAEWDELKQLGERYRQLETELQEKTKMWSRLKDE